MTILVNGESREVPEASTLADLLESTGLASSPCAAEVNGALVPRSEHGATTLGPGDEVEIVTLVGGG